MHVIYLEFFVGELRLRQPSVGWYCDSKKICRNTLYCDSNIFILVAIL